MAGSRADRWHQEAERHLVRDGLAVSLALAASLGIYTAVGCAACFGDEPAPAHQEEVMEAEDLAYSAPAPTAPAVQEDPAPEPPARDPEPAPEQPSYPEEAPPEEAVAEEVAEYGEEEQVVEVPDGDGLTREGGVNWYGGRMETWYSSEVLHHQRTDEWTLDEEGFYHDAEGRYVVAASDMEEGTVFQGSMGECVVLDSGCAEGVTDYYVAW